MSSPTIEYNDEAMYNWVTEQKKTFPQLSWASLCEKWGKTNGIKLQPSSIYAHFAKMYRQKNNETLSQTSVGASIGGLSTEEIYNRIEEAKKQRPNAPNAELIKNLADEIHAEFGAIQARYYYQRKRVEIETKKNAKEVAATKKTGGDCPSCGDVMVLCPNDGVKRCDSCGKTVSFNVPTLVKEVTVVPENKPASTDNVLTTLASIANLGEAAGIDVGQVFAGLQPLFQLAAQAGKAASVDIDALKAENARLKEDLTAANDLLEEANKRVEEVERYKREMDIMRSDVSKLNLIVDGFLKLESLKKIANLEDFTHGLKVYMDKSGFILKTDRVS